MRHEETAIAICDDDSAFLEAFTAQVRKAADRLHIACSITAYGDARELLADIRGGKRLSILLLDVMMDSLDGMALAHALRSDLNDIPVIFVSSNREMALYGYEQNALRYLAKPVDDERLCEALLAAVKKPRSRVIAVQTFDELRRVETSDIAYAEMLRRGVVVHLRNGEVLSTRIKIGEFEQLLPRGDFFRCHQGYIVNMTAIATILRTDAVLEGGIRVPVSRYKLTALRELFLSYLND